MSTTFVPNPFTYQPTIVEAPDEVIVCLDPTIEVNYNNQQTSPQPWAIKSVFCPTIGAVRKSNFALQVEADGPIKWKVTVSLTRTSFPNTWNFARALKQRKTLTFTFEFADGSKDTLTVYLQPECVDGCQIDEWKKGVNVTSPRVS